MLQVQSKAFKWKIFGDFWANCAVQAAMQKNFVNVAEKLVSCPDHLKLIILLGKKYEKDANNSKWILFLWEKKKVL